MFWVQTAFPVNTVSFIKPFSNAIIAHFNEISNFRAHILLLIAKLLWNSPQLGALSLPVSPWLLLAANRMPARKDHWAELTWCFPYFWFCNIIWPFSLLKYCCSKAFFFFKLDLHRLIPLRNKPQIHLFFTSCDMLSGSEILFREMVLLL